MPRITDAEARREQILSAAAVVFARHGYVEATISDIASEAGCAHGTVYLYFKNKADVFQALVSAFLEQLIADLSGPPNAEAGASSLAADLYRMFYRALDRSNQNRPLTRTCMREILMADPEMAAGFHALTQGLVRRVAVRLERAVAAGELRPGAGDLGAFLVVNLLGAATHRLLMLGPEADVPALTAEIVEFILHGLAAEGRAER